MSRPMLLPGLTVLWRGPHTIQLGLDPRRALVLDLPNPVAAGLLDLLDGERTERGVLAAAGRRGIDEPGARALLDTLLRHGLVINAPNLFPRTFDEATRRRLATESTVLALRRGAEGGPASPIEVLRRRSASRVRVTGRGRLGLPIAVALALSGLGHVTPELAGSVQPGEPFALPGGPRDRSGAARQAIGLGAPGVKVSPLPRREDATFVVQVGPPTRPAALHALGHRRLPHLLVEIREGAALVGPLILPGGVPCLNCLDLHRRDRDPAWPMLAAQLSGSEERPGLTEACGTATTLTAVGYATAEVLRYVDGETPQTLGATMEITSPGEVRRRSWQPHPTCTCVRRKRRARSASAVPTGFPPE